MYLESKPVSCVSDTKTVETERRTQPLRASVTTCLELYLNKLGQNKPNNLYRMVINETEYALFKTVLEYTGGNQSKAAECLGISRGTFRKKLKQCRLNGNI
jgi:Fis family transcriptional regulator